MSLLRIENISYSAPQGCIVQPLSATIAAGEVIALVGQSGTGKTTLLYLLSGLLEPTSGQVFLENEPVKPPSQKLIAGHPLIKLVRQDYGLFPNISLQENIAYELRHYTPAYRSERVAHLLEVCGLQAIAHRLPRQTSGGEQQRAVIARAIADEPRLLLLDEPFSHLDRQNKQLVKQEIKDIITAENMGCLLVTHEVSDAYELASELWVMQEGQLVQRGSPTEIYANPTNEYVAQLTGYANWLAEGVGSLPTFTRPEWIRLGVGTEQATVVQSYFVGYAYLLTLQTQGVLFLAYAPTSLSVGSQVCFEVVKPVLN